VPHSSSSGRNDTRGYLLWLFSAFVIVALFAHGAFLVAQSTFGSIRGIAQDPSGLGVPAAQVTIHSLDENTDRTAVSDNTGSFVVENLKPGLYYLTATHAGFENATISKVHLEPRQILRVTLKFAVQQANTVVEVSVAADQINTENGTVSDSKTTSQITAMPLNIRATTTSPLAAVTLSPQVQQDSQGNIALGGAMPAQVGFSVDGISAANVRQNGPLQNAYPSSEAISEVKITSFNNNAEYAQVGDITFTSKSGTNQLHGSLFEYQQNDALDARVYGFSQKAPKSYNTFGGSLGGPVAIPNLYNGKDKSFFFIDYEGNRSQISTPEQFLVPTLAERNGNLSQLVASPLINPATGQPFPNNTIPSSLINPTAKALLQYYPLPNTTSPNGSYNYEALDPTPSTTDGFDTRIDHVLTSKQQAYVRFSWKDITTQVANPLLPNDTDFERDRSMVFSHSYALTPHLLNELRFGFTGWAITDNFPIEGADALQQLGLSGVDIQNHPTADAFPTFNFSDGTGFTPIGRDKAGTTQSRTIEFTDNFSVVRGKHTLRFGFDFRSLLLGDVQTNLPSDDFGRFTFNQGVFTGNAFGDFLLGVPNTAFFATTGPNDINRGRQYGLYGQDEWQVNSHLTVNFGLRWQLGPRFTEEHGSFANFDPATNSIIYPDWLSQNGGLSQGFLQSINACIIPHNTALPCTNVYSNSQYGWPSTLLFPYYRDFQPRVSFAYRPFSNNKTVVRAGFGIFTITNLGPLSFNLNGNPTSALYTWQNQPCPGCAPLFAFPQTIPANAAVQYGGGTLNEAVSPHYRDPQSAQWNVTIERELGTDTTGSISYLGMNSYRLTETVDLNQVPPSTTPYSAANTPYPGWGQLVSAVNGGGQNYQAMQLEVKHRQGHGLFFQANYTWAKNLSDAQGDAPNSFPGEIVYAAPVSNRFDLRADRGNVYATPRQRLLFSGIYQLPFGEGRRWFSHSAWVNRVFGGWELSTITDLHTGPWLTPTISPTLDQSNTNIAGRGTVLRPDCVGNPIPAQQTTADYFNLNAFAPTPVDAGRIGNCGVGILEGPGTIAVNAGLAKVFPIRERAKLRVETTFTNVLNHTNFAPPATNVSNPATFGVLQAAPTGNAGNRTGQIAVRFEF
jgi:hypothetical protein